MIIQVLTRHDIAHHHCSRAVVPYHHHVHMSCIISTINTRASVHVLARGSSHSPRSSSTIAIMPSHQTATDVVQRIIKFLVSSREAMHDRDPREYRNTAAQQAVMLQQTIRGLTPDHSDAGTAIDTLRQATVFTDTERHALIDAVTMRMGQVSSIEAGRQTKFTSAFGQVCTHFFNLCTAVFWAGVMDTHNTFTYAMELAVTQALQIDLRHPREGAWHNLVNHTLCA